jgi:hypothetical protein
MGSITSRPAEFLAARSDLSPSFQVELVPIIEPSAVTSPTTLFLNVVNTSPTGVIQQETGLRHRVSVYSDTASIPRELIGGNTHPELVEGSISLNADPEELLTSEYVTTILEHIKKGQYDQILPILDRYHELSISHPALKSKSPAFFAIAEYLTLNFSGVDEERLRQIGLGEIEEKIEIGLEVLKVVKNSKEKVDELVLTIFYQSLGRVLAQWIDDNVDHIDCEDSDVLDVLFEYGDVINYSIPGLYSFVYNGAIVNETICFGMLRAYYNEARLLNECGNSEGSLACVEMAIMNLNSLQSAQLKQRYQYAYLMIPKCEALNALNRNEELLICAESVVTCEDGKFKFPQKCIMDDAITLGMYRGIALLKLQRFDDAITNAEAMQAMMSAEPCKVTSENVVLLSNHASDCYLEKSAHDSLCNARCTRNAINRNPQMNMDRRNFMLQVSDREYLNSIQILRRLGRLAAAKDIYREALVLSNGLSGLFQEELPATECEHSQSSSPSTGSSSLSTVRDINESGTRGQKRKAVSPTVASSSESPVSN